MTHISCSDFGWTRSQGLLEHNSITPNLLTVVSQFSCEHGAVFYLPFSTGFYSSSTWLNGEHFCLCSIFSFVWYLCQDLVSHCKTDEWCFRNRTTTPSACYLFPILSCLGFLFQQHCSSDWVRSRQRVYAAQLSTGHCFYTFTVFLTNFECRFLLHLHRRDTLAKLLPHMWLSPTTGIFISLMQDFPGLHLCGLLTSGWDYTPYWTGCLQSRAALCLCPPLTQRPSFEKQLQHLPIFQADSSDWFT